MVPAADSLLSAPDTANFGLIRAGLCDTLRLPVGNRRTEGIIIDSVRSLAGDGLFSLINAGIFSGLVIPPEGTAEILLGFCPEEASCTEGRVGVYVKNPGGTQELHVIGVGGCGGVPLVEVKENRVEFGAVPVPECRQESFTLTNAGNYPLRVSALVPGNSVFRVIRPSFFPFTLPPYGEREVVVEFCPATQEDVLDSLLIISDADNPAPPVYLAGKGDVRSLLLPSAFDFGPVLLGTCRDTFLVVRNGGTLPLSVTAALDGLLLPDGFTITSQFSGGRSRMLPPQDTLRIHLRFCPPAAGIAAAVLRITDEEGEGYRTVLGGEGIPPGLWLDTVAAEAGDVLTLTCRTGPEDVIGPGQYRVRLSFNADALSPVSVAAAASGDAAAISGRGKGNVTVSGERFAPAAADGALFTIAFRGLSSGEPVNRVVIEEMEFPVAVPQWDTLAGMVLLSGCDVDRTPGGGKRAHIGGLGPNPAAGSVVVTYLAPPGRRAVLTLYDFPGNRVETVRLPEGTGDMEEFRLDLTGYPRGVYTLELRERNERSWKILLIDR